MLRLPGTGMGHRGQEMHAPEVSLEEAMRRSASAQHVDMSFAREEATELVHSCRTSFSVTSPPGTCGRTCSSGAYGSTAG